MLGAGSRQCCWRPRRHPLPTLQLAACSAAAAAAAAGCRVAGHMRCAPGTCTGAPVSQSTQGDSSQAGPEQEAHSNAGTAWGKGQHAMNSPGCSEPCAGAGCRSTGRAEWRPQACHTRTLTPPTPSGMGVLWSKSTGSPGACRRPMHTCGAPAAHGGPIWPM